MLFFPSILWAGSLSLARTLATPFAKGSFGAWSILLMAHTRVVADLSLKARAASPLHLRCIKERKHYATEEDT